VAQIELLQPTEKIKDSYGKINTSLTNLNNELGTTVKQSVVLNAGTPLGSVVTSGFYRLAGSHPDAPSGIGHGVLIVSRGADIVFQIVTGFAGSRFFMRHGNPPEAGGSGVWQPWRELWHDGNLPYETGVWTPELRFGGQNTEIAYAFRAGQYTRIANVVYWTFGIVLSSKGSASGTATITGLPFGKTPGLGFDHSIARTVNIAVPSGQWPVSYIEGSTINLITNTGSSFSSTEFSNDSAIHASGFYFI